jgi:hypothetical protein
MHESGGYQFDAISTMLSIHTDVSAGIAGAFSKSGDCR